MSRFFNGFGDDSISFSAGALASIGGGPWSCAVLHRPDSGFCGLFHTQKTGTTQFEIWGEGSNYFVFPGGFSQGAGNVTPRYHIVPLEGGSAGVWTHQDGTTTVNDWSTPIDLLMAGHGQRKGNGRIAAIACWNQTFTDGNWQAQIGFTSAQQWFNTLPKGMWLFNQTNVAQPVNDVTGNGANQSATTNPAVDGNDPPGWSYALATLATGSLFLPFFR